jgi:hypothetical protein
LRRVLSAPGAASLERGAACAGTATRPRALGEPDAFLAGLGAADLRAAVEHAPTAELSPVLANYVAAMVAFGCARLHLPAAAWTLRGAPLPQPAFG